MERRWGWCDPGEKSTPEFRARRARLGAEREIGRSASLEKAHVDIRVGRVGQDGTGSWGEGGRPGEVYPSVGPTRAEEYCAWEKGVGCGVTQREKYTKEVRVKYVSLNADGILG